ncbi:MAG: hypothetical protein IJ269_03895 [Bacteroidales bacterium]|nr:hypothetical protein [Bacteroidales bacterium]MBR7168639.1 hypothetical protein [Bacteroidales bacterium]
MTETLKDNKQNDSATGEPSAEKKENIPTSIQKKKEHIKLSDIMGGKILIRKFMLSQIPLMIMIVVYSIAMVSNRYYIENTSIEIKELQKEIKELNIKHIQFKCDYMNTIMISEVAKKLESLGIQQSTDRPLKINIEKE